MRIPQSVKYEISLDKSNGNTLWWEAIVQEMKIRGLLLNVMKLIWKTFLPDIKRLFIT